MNNTTFEFNKQLELDVLLNGLTKVTVEYVDKFDRYNLDDVVIPNGIMCIGRCAFEDCKSLKSVMIANTVTDIGDDAFIRCKNLTSVTIGNNVTHIGYWAFLDCRCLTKITIPNSVARIEWGAFSNCYNLKSVVFKDISLDEVRSMKDYPWGIKNPEKSISVQVS